MSGEFKRTLEVNVNTNVNTKKIQDAEKIIDKIFCNFRHGSCIKIEYAYNILLFYAFSVSYM